MEVKFGRITLLSTKGDEVGSFKISENALGWMGKGGAKQVVVQASEVKSLKWVRQTRNFQLQVRQKGGVKHVFEGFRPEDHVPVGQIVKDHWGQQLPVEELDTRGWHWGGVQVSDGGVRFDVDGDKKAFTLPFTDLLQATQLRDDVQLVFQGKAQTRGVQLVEARFGFPDDESFKKFQASGEQTEGVLQASVFQKQVLEEGGIAADAGDRIANLERVKSAVPRGRFDLEFYKDYCRLTAAQNYRIPYTNIKRAVYVPKPNAGKPINYLVLCMDPPLRRGAQQYPHVVLEVRRADPLVTLEMNLTEEQKVAYPKLAGQMKGPEGHLVARLVKELSKCKMIQPSPKSGFNSSSHAEPNVACNVGATKGQLFILNKRMVFLLKPSVEIAFADVSMVELSRHATASGTTAFDLEVKLRQGATVVMNNRARSAVLFTNINRADRDPLVSFLRSKNIRVKGQPQERTLDINAMDLGEDSGEEALASDDEENDSDFGAASSSEDALEYKEKHSSDSSSSSEEEEEDDEGDEDESAAKRLKKE